MLLLSISTQQTMIKLKSIWIYFCSWCCSATLIRFSMEKPSTKSISMKKVVIQTTWKPLVLIIIMKFRSNRGHFYKIFSKYILDRSSCSGSNVEFAVWEIKSRRANGEANGQPQRRCSILQSHIQITQVLNYNEQKNWLSLSDCM